MGSLPGLDLLDLTQAEFLLWESFQVLFTLGKITQLFQQQNKHPTGKTTFPITASLVHSWRFHLLVLMDAGGRSCILVLPTRDKPPSWGGPGEPRSKRGRIS